MSFKIKAFLKAKSNDFLWTFLLENSKNVINHLNAFSLGKYMIFPTIFLNFIELEKHIQNENKKFKA